MSAPAGVDVAAPLLNAPPCPLCVAQKAAGGLIALGKAFLPYVALLGLLGLVWWFLWGREQWTSR